MAILVDGFEIVIVGDAQHVVQLNLGCHEIVIHCTDQRGRLRFAVFFRRI